MANKAPIFPLPEPPQQFSDYGFDPQFDYLQLMEEARQHKHDVAARSIDAPKFKLQKPTSKVETSKNRNSSSSSYYCNSRPAKKSWWKKTLLLFRFKRRTVADRATAGHDVNAAYRGMRGSVSEPVYMTESRSGSSTPYRTRSRPSSGPLAGTATPARRGEVEIPYLSLTELSMGDEPPSIPASPTPLYLVN